MNAGLSLGLAALGGVIAVQRCGPFFGLIVAAGIGVVIWAFWGED